MHQEGLLHHVAQEAEARHDRAERDGLRDDVGELDFQHVAWLCALDEDRAGEWVHRTGVEHGEIGDCRVRSDLTVERVAGFQGDLFAFADLGGGSDVRVVAVVAAVRFVAERLAAVDPYGVHGGLLC